MKKSTSKVGRPKTGRGVQVIVRMHTKQLRAIDRWIRGAEISRPEAIRRLVGLALNSK